MERDTLCLLNITGELPWKFFLASERSLCLSRTKNNIEKCQPVFISVNERSSYVQQLQNIAKINNWIGVHSYLIGNKGIFFLIRNHVDLNMSSRMCQQSDFGSILLIQNRKCELNNHL